MFTELWLRSRQFQYLNLNQYNLNKIFVCVSEFKSDLAHTALDQCRWGNYHLAATKQQRGLLLGLN